MAPGATWAPWIPLGPFGGGIGMARRQMGPRAPGAGLEWLQRTWGGIGMAAQVQGPGPSGQGPGTTGLGPVDQGLGPVDRAHGGTSGPGPTGGPVDGTSGPGPVDRAHGGTGGQGPGSGISGQGPWGDHWTGPPPPRALGPYFPYPGLLPYSGAVRRCGDDLFTNASAGMPLAKAWTVNMGAGEFKVV